MFWDRASRPPGPLGWRVTARSAPTSQCISASLTAVGLIFDHQSASAISMVGGTSSMQPGCHGPARVPPHRLLVD